MLVSNVRKQQKVRKQQRSRAHRKAAWDFKDECRYQRCAKENARRDEGAKVQLQDTVVSMEGVLRCCVYNVVGKEETGFAKVGTVRGCPVCAREFELRWRSFGAKTYPVWMPVKT